MKTTNNTEKWTLDSLYKGKGDSPEIIEFFQCLKEKVNELIDNLKIPSEKDWESIKHLILHMDDVTKRLEELKEFTLSLTSQDSSDEAAKQLDYQLSDLSREFSQLERLFYQTLNGMDGSIWEKMKEELSSPLYFYFLKQKERLSDTLHPEMENLIDELSIDGYRSWEALYQQSINKLKFTITVDGKEGVVTFGELAKYNSNSKRSIRLAAHEARVRTLNENEDLFASILNHLAGFRTKLYKQRGWDSVLKETLTLNKMSETTLKAMWDTIKDNNQMFQAYFQRKAKLLGVEKLSYFDLFYPISSAEETKKYSIKDAIEFISHKAYEHSFPVLSQFVKDSYDNRWIDSEIRPNKRQGGMAFAFPISQESRLFVNYNSEFNDVTVLAHELGHTFHATVLFDQPSFCQKYPMSLAETASTFNELIVTESTEGIPVEQRLSNIEEKINTAVLYLLYVQFHFHFELEMYNRKKAGKYLSAEELKSLIVAFQKEVFSDCLEHYQEFFWLHTPHFYYIDQPFYNFVYTFGFLFSNGLFEMSKTDPNFEKKYIELLKDTGIYSVEELSEKHLGIDLTKPVFWEKSIQLIKQQIEEFLEITK
ncbi:M3 family metallopeptidase [Bacillus sp. 31A1R]|uniref:M3 family metallopeptidase n=1 Tax=Robertmurraya mangrovi TaxID=3098077 RepID=A0ABU5IWI1_9BACI|nr:M3 family metallopeptidase [Bacillus sp. 31A1R]MDZ5471523.1 M3 family metallopeptidase [Bacillus sp. 31A1R]